MTLKEKLIEDMKNAMKAKDGLTLSTIRLINAGIKQFEVDNRQNVDNDTVITIISKMIKQRKDSAKIYHDAKREDLAEKEMAEIAVLNRYLPTMLTSEEIAQYVAQAMESTGAQGMKDMGKVMGLLKTQLAGKADMREVNKILKQILSV